MIVYVGISFSKKNARDLKMYLYFKLLRTDMRNVLKGSLNKKKSAISKIFFAAFFVIAEN